MHWTELQRLARDAFPGSNPTVPMLLTVWAQHDDGELASLIEPAGLDRASLISAMQALADEPTDADATLLNECILASAESDNSFGWCVLKTLSKMPRHRVTRALVDAKLDLSRLEKVLEGPQHESALGSLAKVGVSVDTKAAPLLRYGRDLTAEAKNGVFDGYYDRPSELQAVVTVLMCVEIGNPILIGESGSGKTALIELLAREVAANRLRGIDPRTRIFAIRIGGLVAGTKYRGEFEQRVEEIIRSASESTPAILFLDEAHLLAGAGRAEGAAMDMGNLIKSDLTHGDLRVIAATTADEFTRHLAWDEALVSRFQQVRIPEPDAALTTKMVKRRAQCLAQKHGIEILSNIVSRAVELTAEHLPQSSKLRESIKLLDAASGRARGLGQKAVTEEILLQLLSEQVGRPVRELKGCARQPLRDLGEKLKQSVIGQDSAIDKVVATVVRQRQKLGTAERNLGTFLFLGPTGVGKTELAKQTAKHLYGGQKSLLILDMAEYNDPGATSKLIGAAPGFVGSEKEGALVQWLQNHPTGGVLLFDEIEKAHREIQNLLLGLLDNGRVRSARGKVMDCRHCVVVMTSNAITTEDLAKGPLGFGEAAREIDPAELLTKDFPREFLGRLDDIVLFNSLSEEDIQRIVRLRVEEAVERLGKRRIRLTCDIDRLTGHLASLLKVSKSGARGIGRVVEKHLLEPIALATLKIDDDGDIEAEINDNFYSCSGVSVRPAA